MKRSTPALIGAIVISGGCLSLPGIAFADEVRTGEAGFSMRAGDRAAAAGGASEKADGCRAGTHAHAASCTCARCAAANAE